MDILYYACTGLMIEFQIGSIPHTLSSHVKGLFECNPSPFQHFPGNQRPSLLLRSDNFPYTKAVMLESLRLHPPAPLGAPHCASQDTKLAGYDIDKGTIILPNFLMALQDFNQWEDAGDFRPERFLNEDGSLATRETLGFSIGELIWRDTTLNN